MTVRAAADDAGAAGLVTLFAVLLLLTAAAAGLAVAGDLSVTAARARAAADAAALAGVGMSPLVRPDLGTSADAAAREVAQANDARFVAGDTSGWPLRYRVVVEVEPTTRWVRQIIGPVRAQAVGAVRPAVPTTERSGV